MRVLMLGWEFPPVMSGGIGIACYGLTKALTDRGVEVTFVLPRCPQPPDASDVEWIDLYQPEPHPEIPTPQEVKPQPPVPKPKQQPAPAQAHPPEREISQTRPLQHARYDAPTQKESQRAEAPPETTSAYARSDLPGVRSEERRGGKEGRSRWSADP